MRMARLVARVGNFSITRLDDGEQFFVLDGLKEVAAGPSFEDMLHAACALANSEKVTLYNVMVRGGVVYGTMEG